MDFNGIEWDLAKLTHSSLGLTLGFMTFFFGDMTIVNGFIKQLIAEEHHLLSAFLHPML